MLGPGDGMTDQRGEISLVGLIVSMTIFLIVLSATLQMFSTSERVNRDATERNDVQDSARLTLDKLSRQLRNLASPTPEQPQGVDRAQPTDLIFQTVEATGPNTGSNKANVKRVRYCLDSSQRLHRQEQNAWTSATPPAVPSGTACPSGGWNADYVVAGQVVNGSSSPLFTFNSTTLTAITRVGVDLWVDLDPARSPAASRLTTTVYLRNQNRSPIAAFTATPTSQGLVLNGSASTDPEDDPLTYCWYDSSAANVASPPSPCEAGPYIGSGITFTYAIPADATRSIWLVVYDSALLLNRTTARSITNAGGVQ
jgi:hypothetical protein